MPGPLKRLGPGSQNLSGMATRPGEVVVEEVDRGGGDEPTWMQGLESVMEGEESVAGSQGADSVGSHTPSSHLRACGMPILGSRCRSVAFALCAVFYICTSLPSCKE